MHDNPLRGGDAMSENDEAVATRIGLARAHADAYDREYPWRAAGEAVLAASVFEYISTSSPDGTPTDELREIAQETLRVLEQIR